MTTKNQRPMRRFGRGEGVMSEEKTHDWQESGYEQGEKIANVVCPQCKKRFVLDWNGYGKMEQTLMMRGCPSGGIYDVYIQCPHCDYTEEL